jgi:hypothetical protein
MENINQKGPPRFANVGLSGLFWNRKGLPNTTRRAVLLSTSAINFRESVCCRPVCLRG